MGWSVVSPTLPSRVQRMTSVRADRESYNINPQTTGPEHAVCGTTLMAPFCICSPGVLSAHVLLKPHGDPAGRNLSQIFVFEASSPHSELLCRLLAVRLRLIQWNNIFHN
jgi:hypothetical protein